MRLCLAGHARPFTDVQAHITANRVIVAERLEALPARAARARPDHGVRRRPARLRRGDHGRQRELVAAARRSATCTHLEVTGRAQRAEAELDGRARALDASRPDSF